MQKTMKLSSLVAGALAIGLAGLMAVSGLGISKAYAQGDAGSVALSDAAKTIYVGKTYDLTAIPSNDANGDTLDVSNPTITWTSSNTAVAKVDSKGVVTAVKAGTADITVTYTYNSLKPNPENGLSTLTATATATITVKKYSQSPKITNTTIKVKQSKVKKGKVTLKNAIKVSGAKTKKTFKKVRGCKGVKISSNGTITISKNYGKCKAHSKKGKKHKVVVKVTCAASAKYKSGSYTKTMYIKTV